MELLKELDHIQLMIANARQHPVIKERLAAFGYNDTRIQQALDFLARVQDEQQNQRDEQNTYTLLKDTVDSDTRELRQQFTDHRALAKVALRGSEAAYRQLELHLPQEKKSVQWQEQVARFYDAAPKHQKALSKYGLNAAAIEQGKAMIASLRQSRQQMFQHKGNAQHATYTRNQVLQSLRQWHRSFKAIARVALENEPQLLESLGIVVGAK